MKKSVLGFIAIFICTLSFAQTTEFKRQDNGLIYPDSTIKQLKFIVDSLNIKFRVCELTKQYRAKEQAMAHYKGDIKTARQDLINGISFYAFLKKYPNVVVDSNLLVVRYNYKNYKEEEVIDFSSVELSDKHDHSILFTENLQQYQKPLQGKWIFDYGEKTTYSDESLKAFYFLTDLQTPVLPEKYAKLVQYSECMIDTTAEIFTEKAEMNAFRFNTGGKSAIGKFISYVDAKTGKPEYEGKYTDENYKKYKVKLNIWDSCRFIKTDSLRRVDKSFNRLFKTALDEAIEK